MLAILGALTAGYTAGRVRPARRLSAWALETAAADRASAWNPETLAAEAFLALALAATFLLHPARAARSTWAYGRPEERLPAPELDPGWVSDRKMIRRDDAGVPDESASAKDLIRYLFDHAGIVPGETAKLCGVSPNAVALWRAGAAPNGAHLARLRRLAAVANDLPGRTAKDRRKALFAYAADGWSLWATLLHELRKDKLESIW